MDLVLGEAVGTKIPTNEQVRVQKWSSPRTPHTNSETCLFGHGPWKKYWRAQIPNQGSPLESEKIVGLNLRRTAIRVKLPGSLALARSPAAPRSPLVKPSPHLPPCPSLRPGEPPARSAQG